MNGLPPLPKYSAKTENLLCAAGTIVGIVGTLINSFTTNLQIKFVVFFIWAISSIILDFWAISARNKWFFILENVYLALSCVGLYTHWNAFFTS